MPVKLSNKKIKYIRRQASKKTPEKIAAELRKSVKDIQKVLKMAGGKSTVPKEARHHIIGKTGKINNFHLVAIFFVVVLLSPTTFRP